MSLPMPDKVPSGAERPPPARARDVRPYKERIALADKLVEKTSPGRGDRASFPNWAGFLMVAGAFAPLAYAHPAIRGALFGDLGDALYPASAGLSMISDALYAGWLGALMVCLGGVLGLCYWAVASPGYRGIVGRRLAFFVLALIGLGASFAMWSLRDLAGDAVSMGIAAWVAVTAGAGIYGAVKSVTRTDWHISVYGAIALLLGGRFIMGSLAVLFLALSDKEFPGQQVALYSWRRSQVSIEPVREARAPQYAEGDWHEARRRHGPWATLMSFAPRFSAMAMIVGAFAPIAYAPPLREALFGPLADSLMPASWFVVVAADLFWTLNPMYVIYIGVTAAAGLWGASFAWRKQRPSAVLGGAILLLVGGRVIAAVIVIVLMLLTSDQYKAHEAPHAPAAHEEGHAAH